jgi:hypothetical protein
MSQSTLFFFSTRTGFASHLGCSTFLMKSIDTRLASSARMPSLFVRHETIQLLPDRPRLRVHFEFVLGHLSRDSRHVRRLKCEHFPVVSQELDERSFLFVVEAGAYNCGLAPIRESEVDSFSFLSQLYRGHDRCFIQGDCKTLLRRFVIKGPTKLPCGKSYRVSTVRAICMAPRKHSVTPWKSTRTMIIP